MTLRAILSGRFGLGILAAWMVSLQSGCVSVVERCEEYYEARRDCAASFGDTAEVSVIEEAAALYCPEQKERRGDRDAVWWNECMAEHYRTADCTSAAGYAEAEATEITDCPLSE